jgi:D-sedoheptulose 7-phosphate isomerase
MPAQNYSHDFLNLVLATARLVDATPIERMAERLAEVRERGGRLFILGVGGSAANASHAVNDFRKLCGIETYAPTDNVSELTARTNDDGWETVFSGWLRISRLSVSDALLILSVGGGNAEKNVSVNLIRAIDYAKTIGTIVLGIVGRDGGYTKQRADCFVRIPTVNEALVTPLAEAFQAVVWHALCSHPVLAMQKAKWESISA